MFEENALTDLIGWCADGELFPTEAPFVDFHASK
jgi:hypothetical protein